MSQAASNKPQPTYLLTYSSVNQDIFPSRESFGKVCADAFGDCVGYYAVCKEKHQDGSDHYHA